jgi:hypothetical protein
MKIFSLKTSLIIGFTLSTILSFFMGYSLGKTKNQFENAVVEIAPLQTIATEIDTTSSKIYTKVNELEKILTQLENVSEKTLSALQLLETQATQPTIENQNPSVSSQAGKQTPENSNLYPIETVEGLDEKTLRELKISLALIDSKNVEQKAEQMFLGEAIDREEAIKAIAKVSSPEVRAEIMSFIRNPDEDMGVRLTAIESIDWEGESETLINLFQTDDSHEIRLATVNSARETEFDNSEKEKIDQVLFENFQAEPNDFVRLAILDYFSDVQLEKVEQLLTLVPPDNFSSEVREHVELLRKQLLPEVQNQ